MNSGFYAACAGLVAKSHALDIAANNLANLNTPGYKAERGVFESVLADASGAGANPVSDAVNEFGVLGGSMVDMRSGQVQNTGNDLDLAIDGPGFFKVQTPAGIRYTRNGSFQVSTSGTIVTSNGDPVLDGKSAIQVPSGRLSISSDGTISANGAVVGKLQLVEFAPGTELVPQGNSNYEAPAKSERAASTSSLTQGALEGSNMNPIEGAISLVVVQRNAEMLQRALSVFHTEFNRVATEDLPRITG